MKCVQYIVLLQLSHVAIAWISSSLKQSATRITRRRQLAIALEAHCSSDDFVWQRQGRGEWESIPLHNNTVALETWKWCADFVVPLELCPWAAKSVDTRGALRIFVVKDRNDMQEAVNEASRRLLKDVDSKSVDPNVAIAFVVSSTRDWEFASFFECFDELEERFLDSESDVTLAPFHPDWEYGGGLPELDIEKKSPYPTVSIVCTSVIDRAGDEATQRIGQHNEDVLLDIGISKLRHLYDTAVYNRKDTPS